MDDLSAGVPIPYLLFSQTNTQGRFQSLAWKKNETEATPMKVSFAFLPDRLLDEKTSFLQRKTERPSSTDDDLFVKREITDHVVRLEDLTLVGSSISVHSESDGLLLEVLLSERDSSSDGDLSSDDSVSSKERRSEHVHGSSLSVGHSGLST